MNCFHFYHSINQYSPLIQSFPHTSYFFLSDACPWHISSSHVYRPSIIGDVDILFCISIWAHWDIRGRPECRGYISTSLMLHSTRFLCLSLHMKNIREWVCETKMCLKLSHHSRNRIPIVSDDLAHLINRSVNAVLRNTSRQSSDWQRRPFKWLK